MADFYQWVMNQEGENDLTLAITKIQGEITFGRKKTPLPPSKGCLRKAFQYDLWIPDYQKLKAIKQGFSQATMFDRTWWFVKVDNETTPAEQKIFFIQRIFQAAFSAAWCGREKDISLLRSVTTLTPPSS